MHAAAADPGVDGVRAAVLVPAPPRSRFPTAVVKRERVRQYGNAVTPPASEVLVSALSEAVSLGGVRNALGALVEDDKVVRAGSPPTSEAVELD